jgi:hypothetical protein
MMKPFSTPTLWDTYNTVQINLIDYCRGGTNTYEKENFEMKGRWKFWKVPHYS